MKRRSAKSADSNDDKPSVLDRLTDLRNDISGSSAVTELLDILIDANGGDSAALAEERAVAAAEDAAATGTGAEEPDPHAEDTNE